MSIGLRIKQARKQANLTQAALAAKVGMAQGTIADLEGGKSKGTTLIASFARELGVSALWLETGKGLREQGHSAADLAAAVDYVNSLDQAEDGISEDQIKRDIDAAANERLMSAIRLLTFFNGTDDDGRMRIMRVAERVPMITEISIVSNNKA